jgi:nitrate ABC transporter ATP-binding subunit
MERYLEIWNLNKTYATPRGPAVIVEDFRLDIDQGEFVSLIGHSGCGKSTVLAILAGLSTQTAGAVCIARREIDGPNVDRGVVFQSPSLLPWMSAIDNVVLAAAQARPDLSAARIRDVAADYLRLVGLGDSLHKMPAELSQGMQQRVGIARAFAMDPKVLLLDEPFGMLDSLTRIDLQQVLADLCARDHKTALMVTHDIDEAIFLSDRVAMMTSGPAATLGKVVSVPFPRPRDRVSLMLDPHYDRIRDELVEFLEHQSHPPALPITEARVPAPPRAASLHSNKRPALHPSAAAV